jgi:hypothetical protein
MTPNGQPDRRANGKNHWQFIGSHWQLPTMILPIEKIIVVVEERDDGDDPSLSIGKPRDWRKCPHVAAGGGQA